MTKTHMGSDAESYKTDLAQHAAKVQQTDARQRELAMRFEGANGNVVATQKLLVELQKAEAAAEQARKDQQQTIHDWHNKHR